MDQIEVEGLRITFRRTGEGPPLVLLHGFAGDSREWRRQIDDLSDEFTVVAWDAPGSGGYVKSPKAEGADERSQAVCVVGKAKRFGRIR